MERIGSRQSIESLRNDVQGVHAGLKELLSRTGDIQAPSWRFPERLATSLDTEGLLKDATSSASSTVSGQVPKGAGTREAENCSTHVLLLELLVDRLAQVS